MGTLTRREVEILESLGRAFLPTEVNKGVDANNAPAMSYIDNFVGGLGVLEQVKMRGLFQLFDFGMAAVTMDPMARVRNSTIEDMENYLEILENSANPAIRSCYQMIRLLFTMAFMSDPKVKEELRLEAKEKLGKTKFPKSFDSALKKSFDKDVWPPNPRAPSEVDRPLEIRDYEGPIFDDADFVVVGSGPGGALIAKTLAEQGKSVIVLEAGPVLRLADYTKDIGESLSRNYWENGMRFTRGNVFMPTLQGRCLGGTSVFNGAICMRMPDWAAEKWAYEDGVTGWSVEDLAPHYDIVEKFSGVIYVDERTQGRRNELFRKGADSMGFDPQVMQRNTPGCKGSGDCIYGCPNGAKTSTDRRGIPEAIAAGARVYTSVSVDKVTLEGKRATGVSAHVSHPKTGAHMFGVNITARAVILAAGVCGTPMILNRSGLRNRNIGANLRTHPGAIILGQYEDEVLPWSGAAYGYHVTKFLEEGIKLESIWAAPSLFSARFKGLGAEYQEILGDYRNMASWDAWVSGDDSVGRLTTLPRDRADMFYDMGRGDLMRLREATAKLCEMHFAAGAIRIFTGLVEPYTTVDSMKQVEEIRNREFKAAEVATGSNHIFGTTAMGADTNRHVCKSNGAVHEYDDLYVCDTSLYPSSPGVNPMLTIMAFGRKLGMELASEY